MGGALDARLSDSAYACLMSASADLQASTWSDAVDALTHRYLAPACRPTKSHAEHGDLEPRSRARCNRRCHITALDVAMSTYHGVRIGQAGKRIHVQVINVAQSPRNVLCQVALVVTSFGKCRHEHAINSATNAVPNPPNARSDLREMLPWARWLVFGRDIREAHCVTAKQTGTPPTHPAAAPRVGVEPRSRQRRARLSPLPAPTRRPGARPHSSRA